MTVVRSLIQFDTYIRGGSTKSLKRYMRYYDNRIDALNQDFKSIVIDDESVKKHIKLMLTNLGVSKYQWDKYFGHDLTVYDFLLMLGQAGHLQMAYLVRVIDRKERVSRMAIATGILLPAGIVASVLCSPPMKEVLESVRAFFASADSLPILGIVKTSISSAINLYRIFSNTTQSLFNRMRDATFVVAKAAINYVGYALWLASAVTMTPVVATLFAVSSFLDVAKEVFCLVQEVVQHNRAPAICEGDELNTTRNRIRHEIGYKTHLYAAIINLVTVVAVVGIMAAWTFAPGGIFVALACVAALAIVYAIQYFALRENRRVMRDELQNKLEQAEADYLQSNSCASELSIEDDLSNDLINFETPAPADKPVSAQRQITMPSARSLPFFAQSSKSDDKAEELEASQNLSFSSGY